ncbi:IS3 family transposase [Kitasatospora sp. NPDC059648]|uniref:IS3 family transposase n=1 Tax=Kitasatospora sp. NPDC059648 TaxID=3346894 RepID=UPI0036C4DC9B
MDLRQSMGRTGICYDSAAAESFFGLLKAEIGTTVWESREAARADVFRFIEVEYNRTRLRKHPEFGHLTPLETRARLQHDFTPRSVSTRCPRSGGNFTRPLPPLLVRARVQPTTIRLQGTRTDAVGTALVAQIYDDNAGHTSLRFDRVGP